MNDSPLIFIIGGAIFLFIGIRGLRDGEVYRGRLIRFIRPKLVLRSRIAVLVFGVGWALALLFEGMDRALCRLGPRLAPVDLQARR